MVEYNKIIVKLSDSQLNKLKTTAKNQTGVNLRTDIKMFNGNNLPHELLLTTRQTSKLINTNESKISTDMKLFRAQISKITQSGRSPNWITAAASVIDAGILKKIHGFGITTLIISNEEMNDIMKLFKVLKILIFCWKELLKQLIMKQKSKKEEF